MLLAAFITLASSQLLAALLFAALCHELGHYLLLRRLGAEVELLRITPFGAEMKVSGRSRLSYGGEILAVAAGPAINLLLAPVLAITGQWWDTIYLFAGAQMILGLFNLLPIRPLDGGTLFWLLLAWCIDPFAADRGTRAAEWLMITGLTFAGVMLWYKTGSPFLLLGAIGAMRSVCVEKKLVKRGRSR